MDSNYKAYKWQDSFERLDAYLSASDTDYEERDTLPDRDDLTYRNGYYANCAALFVDIRDSSKLPKAYTRPRLAKIYRAFISEMVAIMNSDIRTREVNIVGDCVWAVYNTPLQTDIDDVFEAAFRANSLMKTLGAKMQQTGYPTLLKAGIGMSWGRALMIKAGHSGSGLDDVVYMGDVVNRAAHLAAEGNRGFHDALMVDGPFYDNLDEYNQGLLRRIPHLGCYSGNVIHREMDAWHEDTYG